MSQDQRLRLLLAALTISLTACSNASSNGADLAPPDFAAAASLDLSVDRCDSFCDGGVSVSDAAPRPDTLPSAADALFSDASTCSPAPAALPSGPLTRNPTNPLVRNGPEIYDDEKTGPRVVLKMGPTDYRLWYEAVSSSGITAVAYATSSDGLAWKKRGVVMSPDVAWEKSEVSPNAMLVESGTFKLWYHGGGYPGKGGVRLGKAAVGYAESLDGIQWTKHGPEVLDIGSSGAFDESQAAEPRVLRVGPGYRMYYTGRNSVGENALGIATSSDGIVWKKAANNPILSVAQWGGFWGGAFLLDRRGVWNLWHGVQVGSTGSALHYMWSDDGLTWNDGPSNPVLVPSSDSNAADYQFVGDSVSGYMDGAQYRIMYTGFNKSFGALGRFEGVCTASITATCP